jgi:hypothetical protein
MKLKIAESRNTNYSIKSKPYATIGKADSRNNILKIGNTRSLFQQQFLGEFLTVISQDQNV